MSFQVQENIDKYCSKYVLISLSFKTCIFALEIYKRVIYLKVIILSLYQVRIMVKWYYGKSKMIHKGQVEY